MFLAGFDPVDALNGMQIDRVNSKPIKGVRRQRDNVAFAQTRDDVADPVWLRFIGMDAQNFRGQEGLPRFPNCTSHKDGNYHSTSHGASCGVTHVMLGCGTA